MSSRMYKYAGIFGLILVSGLFAACGGTGSTSTAAYNPPASPSFTATVVPTPMPPTPTPLPPTATPMPTKVVVAEELSDEDVLAQGKLIFEKTAGGAGCAMCHGMDATGDPLQGAPSNLGADWQTIEQALYDRPQMSFITLTRDEIKAVASYLQWLEAQQ